MGMLEAMADDETTGLVAGELAAGDSSSLSLESLYARHAAPLARALHAAGVPDAHDAVQEAFVQAVVHWRKVSRYDDPLSWIRRVAINRGHNRRRARRRQQAVAERIATTRQPVATERGDPDEDLTRLVAALPPQQRLALSLYYFADLSVAEVADSMKLSEGAVKYHLHAARASLAHSLENGNGEPNDH
jgi:RNA polymerase sigma-70 factor (ECF subfamily)